MYTVDAYTSVVRGETIGRYQAPKPNFVASFRHLWISFETFVSQKELRDRDAVDLGVVLKIETKKGFQNLPWMLLQVRITVWHY